MGEQPIFSTKAHVFQIDPNTKKKWLPVSSQAINVSYYYDSNRNTYRIISVEGSKAVINSTILPSMTFTKTSQKFGQWSDPRANTVYGLGFPSEAECTKFVEKFKEVKELTKEQKSPNLDTKSNGVIENPDSGDQIRSDSPIQKPNSPQIQADSTTAVTERKNSSNTAPVSSNQLIDQYKYENDRLKIALAQSSANAKKWEVELQTLKNNNARLTTALQESTSNVEEWKKQLAAYKEESARMKKKLMETEKMGGSELLQRQIVEMRDKANEAERLNQQKENETMELKRRLDEAKQYETKKKKVPTATLR